MEEVLMDDKGRILIPKDVRDQIGLKPGNTARLTVEHGRLIVTPPITAEEFIRELEGCIKEGEPTIDPMKLKEMWEPRVDGRREDVR